MKDSKEKEHRISNLKDMMDNVSSDDVSEIPDDLEEDMELINYLNEESADDYGEIDDEFIYHPDEDGGTAINLEDASIDEDYLIKTPSEKKLEEDEDGESEDAFDEFSGDLSESFDNLVSAKVGRTPILAVVSAFLGLLLIAIGAFVFSLRSDRIIDNVVSGETNFISVIFLIFGILLFIYGAYRIFGFKNPLENLSRSIDSVEDENLKAESDKKDKAEEKVIPKSNIPLDKESYKIGEFKIKDLKNKLKKPSAPKPAQPTQEELDKIPPAREKPENKKGLTAEEIEEMEYKQAVLENESIDDIFAEVEDIEDMPIISVDSQDNKKE